MIDKLGKYELRGVLGRGAMGTVYEAWDPQIARQVAIKTVRLPDGADSEERELLSRFQQEAQAAGRLHHPNIVGVFDYAETDELAYIVMEFVAGRTLKAILEEGRPIPLAETARLMDGLLTGLTYSHGHDVIHRDIKPANVMVTADGTVKIADFGIARIGGSGMTLAGSILGTPAYMSPEQFRGTVVDARSDIYSAGVVLFLLLTGRRPFEGSMATIMQAVLNESAPPVSALVAGLPPGLDEVVACAMAQSPEDRFADAASFRQAMHLALRSDGLRAATLSGPGPGGGAGLEPGLGDLLGGDATVVANSGVAAPGGARPVRQATAAGTARPRKRRSSSLPWVMAGVAALLALGGGGTWYALTRPDPPPVPPTPAGPVRIAVPVQREAEAEAVPPGRDVTDHGGRPRADPRDGGRAGDNQTVMAMDAGRPAYPPSPEPQTKPAPPTQPAPGSSPVLPVEKPAPALRADIPGEQVAAVLAMLRPVTCAHVEANGADGALRLGGVVGGGAPERALREGAQKAVAELERRRGSAPALEWEVKTVVGPYCGLIDTLGPYLQAGSPRLASGSQTGLGIAMTDGRTELREHDLVIARATMPDFAGALQLDYVSNDGAVLHMRQSTGAPYPAKATPIFGQKALPGFTGWEIGCPFGTDLVVGVASSTPLFKPPGVKPETIDAYLKELRAGLDRAAHGGGQISAALLVLHTAPLTTAQTAPPPPFQTGAPCTP